jgi:hypothetical protein
MRKAFQLRWYEWIGWLVDALMIAGSIAFVSINMIEGETRAALIGFAVTLLPVGLWSWILLCFGKSD